MESSASLYLFKIKELLEKFLQSKCPIEIYLHLDTFLSHLCPNESDVESSLISLPVFTEWITQAVTMWSVDKTIVSTNIAHFTLNLASLLSKSEEKFCVLNTNNFFIKLVNVSKARQSEVSPSLRLAYIKLLSAFLEHKSGIEWMIACTFWEDVLQLALAGPTPEIVKESHGFLSKILEKTIDYDENFCHSVVKRITLPLGETIYKSIKACVEMADIADHVMSQNIGPSLGLIGTILEYFLERIYFGQEDFRVVLVFLDNFSSDERISDFMLIAQNKCFAFGLGKIMFIMQFLELYVNRSNVGKAAMKTSVRKIMDVFVASITKSSNRNFDDILKFCDFGVLFWQLVGTKILTCGIDNEAITFANELILLTSVPSGYCLVIKYCFSIADLEEELLVDDFRDAYMQKMLKICTQQAVRVYYTWRDFLIGHPNLVEICMKTLSYILKSRKYFPREIAVVVVQTLIYTLKDFMCVNNESPEKLANFPDGVAYCSLLFEVLVTLFEEFSITWKDSFEAIDVLAVSVEVLSLPDWPSDVVVKILKLIDVAVAKYMTPNLALLVDTTTDSTVVLLGPALDSKLHETACDVKKSALDVVCTISRMSISKFPSLQKVLMDSELPTLVVKMSTCDGESFVRATAIKCLQEMIQVEEIWNNALMSENLSEKMREILLNETEGIVRVEAATFMCIAYEQQQFPRDSLDGIYETMIHSSTTDLHWEVKVRALGFWDKVIKNHLQNQGMIDGSFPNVTFSKEHRKIVTLTDSEIRKRLLKVLSQLSAIGCLGVLVSAIKDDCDMEVSKTAVKITQHLVELFKKYNIYGEHSAPTSPLPTENGSSMSVSSGISVDDVMESPASYHPDFNDEIIDQIVNSKDVCLLKSVYSPSDYGSVSNYDIQVRKIVSPNEFLQYTQQDLNNIIQEKKNWLNGIEDLGSLLDDMLKTYDDDVNNMDCY